MSIDAAAPPVPAAPLDLTAGLTTPRGTDYYLLSDLLTDARTRDPRPGQELRRHRRCCRSSTTTGNGPQFPFELVPKIAQLGVVGGAITGYGCPGLSRLAAGMVTLELSRGDGSVNTFLGVQNGLAMGSINMLGSEEQKQRWLPAMARLDKVGAFAPDRTRSRLRLRRPGNHRPPRRRPLGAQRRQAVDRQRQHRARRRSSGPGTSPTARSRASWWRRTTTLESRPATPTGYSAELITGKIGKRAIWQPDITLTDVRVPADNKLAEANSFRDVSRVLTATRGGASWEAAGHAVAAYEAALTYAGQREQFGKPIAGYQLVQNKLANMLAEVTTIQLMCFRMAQLQEQGKLTGPMASLAKMYTAQKARGICMEARDILGGNGLLLDYHVARHMTDMEVVHTYEGTDSIQSLIVGRDVTGMSAFA